MQNYKEILIQGMDALFKDFDEQAIRSLFREDYIQHNPNVPTGLEPIIGLLPILKEANFNYTTHRMIQDNDLIVTHNSYFNAEIFGAAEVVAFDIWRMEQDKIAEHWDAIIPKVEKTASGRSQVDGFLEIKDLDLTESNKKLVEDFVTDVFQEGNIEKVPHYIEDDNYAQHNPMFKDGTELFKGPTDGVAFQKIHRIIGEGNFVFAQNETFFSGKPIAMYDLFRVENQKIVEHWDVMQEVPESMAHTNGMF